MHSGLFITAIGTEVGKTFVTCAMLHQLFRAGIAVGAIKPVASGFVSGDPNSDPARLLRAMGRPHHQSAIDDICPWRYAQALSPNLAAAREGKSIPWDKLVAYCRQKMDAPEITLLEGAGGVMSPITDTHLNLDLISALKLPVILVASNYLGAVSHTLTAIEVLTSQHIPLMGLVISESEEPAIAEHEFRQLIFNRQMHQLPIVWVPRASAREDAYKFIPSLEPIWNSPQSL